MRCGNPARQLTATGASGAVSTPHILASHTAIAVLKQGGNAVDAAVAAAAVSAVVQPFTSSIGGLGWATVHMKAAASTEVLEFHGHVPRDIAAGAFPEGPDGVVDWAKMEQSGQGLLGSLVPGLLAGWQELVTAKGTIPLGDLLGDAIAYAEKGFAVSELLHDSICANAARLRRWPSSERVFFRNGEPIRAGETLVQAELAQTLRLVAQGGIRHFYEGEIGRALVDFYHRNGGALSMSDLEHYRAVWHQPLVGTYRGYTIRCAPAPLGDLSFLQGLALLDRFPVFAGPTDVGYLHASIETAKLVSADRRTFLGDVGHPPALLQRLLSDEHIADMAGQIGTRAMHGVPAGTSPSHTITLAVVDADGNAVHLMQTVGSMFGTGAIADDTGILTNSSMYFADADPGHANGIRPGAKLEQNPVVMMAFDARGELAFIFGSPGGKTRVETVRQMVVNFVDFGMEPQAAVGEPRFVTHADGTTVEVEQGLHSTASDALEALAERGHDIKVTGRLFGTGQAICIDAGSGLRTAAADWRQESAALAY